MNRKILLVTMTLLVVAMLVTPVIAAPAIKIPVAGSFTGSATGVPEIWISEEGILHIRDATGAGTASGDLLGSITFKESVSIDLITGDGSAHGEWVFTDDYGTFEGRFRTKHWDVVFYEGTALGQGTGAYEGMVYEITSFWGYNLYVGGYVGPDGVYFESEGTILSPQGVPLPP